MTNSNQAGEHHAQDDEGTHMLPNSYKNRHVIEHVHAPSSYERARIALARGDPILVHELSKDDLTMSDSQGDSLLLNAIELRREEQAIALINAGTHVNTLGAQRRSPLHAAAKAGLINVVVKLIAAGAEVNALDEDHSTPLHSAALMGRERVITYLLEHGADGSVRDRAGRSAYDIINAKKGVGPHIENRGQPLKVEY